MCVVVEGISREVVGVRSLKRLYLAQRLMYHGSRTSRGSGTTDIHSHMTSSCTMALSARAQQTCCDRQAEAFSRREKPCRCALC